MELSKMTAMEAKLDAIMNIMNKQERKMHTAHEIGVVERELLRGSADVPTEELFYDAEEVKYLGEPRSYHFKPNPNLPAHYHPALRNHENFSYGGGASQGPRHGQNPQQGYQQPPRFLQQQQGGENKNEYQSKRRAQPFEDQMLQFMGDNKKLLNLHEQKFAELEASNTNSQIFQKTTNASLMNLETVLQRCKDKQLALNWEKCHFMVTEGIVLGHKISATGLEVDQSKISIIKTLAPPTIVKGIRSFLGHAGFYRRFIKDFSKIARPLCRLLEKDKKFNFDDSCKAAFEEIKIRLVQAPITTAPDWDQEFEVMCDASDFAMGAVLGQRKEKIFRAIYYASRTFNEGQENYSTTEKEMLAIVFACEKFRPYILGSHVIVHTDHAAIKYLM